ncbi:hypothetical protein V2J09_002468 [Rumex salicifolius]
MASSSSTMLVHQITKDEFNLFHSIDRRLFSILIFVLGNDANDATRVMALWIWLERVFLKSTIVHTILSLSYQTISALFEESKLCLHVAAYGPAAANASHVPALTALLKRKNIDLSLHYFHENKALVLHGVGKIVDGVCFRAFKDIVDQLKGDGSGPRAGRASGSNGCDDTNEVGGDLIDEIDTKMGIMNINDGINGEEERLGEGKEIRGGSNNKTLFLTFSKGYPISKTEVREFFNRCFGDVIEGLHMQEVGENEQPLYARLVVRDVSMMNLVLQGQRKVKFNINGKHACVRKYVRRRSESPPTLPAMD